MDSGDYIRKEKFIRIGDRLTPDVYELIGEVSFRRVRIINSQIECLINEEGRVKDIMFPVLSESGMWPAPQPVKKVQLSPETQLVKQSEDSREIDFASLNPDEIIRIKDRIATILDKYILILERFSGDRSICKANILDITSGKNLQLYKEYVAGGLPGLKAYLIRELFKRTTIDNRGFRMLLLLSAVIAMNEEGKLEKYDVTEAGEQLTLMENFLQFLKEVGQRQSNQWIFDILYESFSLHEKEDVKKGDAGYYIRHFYETEAKRILDMSINDSNSNYVKRMFRAAMKEDLKILYDNILATLKAMAVIRIYSSTEVNVRGGDSKTIEDIIRDIIGYQPEALG